MKNFPIKKIKDFWKMVTSSPGGAIQLMSAILASASQNSSNFSIKTLSLVSSSIITYFDKLKHLSHSTSLQKSFIKPNS